MQLDLILDIKRALKGYSNDLQIDHSMNIDKGYGIEGSTNEISVEFDSNGNLSSVTAFYMHFITELDCEFDITDDFEENYIISMIFKHDTKFRELFLANYDENTITNVLENWESLRHGDLLPLSLQNSVTSPLWAKHDCKCEIGILLSSGCKCEAFLADMIKKEL